VNWNSFKFSPIEESVMSKFKAILLAAALIAGVVAVSQAKSGEAKACPTSNDNC
jgi:hypothetical protein